MRITELLNYFKPLTIFEGGNVQIGPHSAERIDLIRIPRAKAAEVVNTALTAINQAYASAHNGIPLWSTDLLKSKNFLSGSSFHFLNPEISDADFVKFKPSVGDVDTQVDISKKDEIEAWLQSIQDKTIGPAKFIGYKPSGEQFITLWEFSDPAIKVQIDLELVEYADGEPTEWSRFSHSSDWDDLQSGVKGVFHKYLMRALTTNSLMTKVVKTEYKTKPPKYETVTDTNLAFSVTGGLREKYKDTGEKLDGLPVFTKVPPAKSEYVNDIGGMFSMLFNRKATDKDKSNLGSFVGCLELINKYLKQSSKETVMNGFIRTLFDPSAQALYRGEPEKDKQEKLVAMNLLISRLGLENYYNSTKSKIDTSIDTYYSNYKIQEDSTDQDSTVKSSTRQGIQHLQKMNDLEFIELVKKIKSYMHGKLGNVKMSLKIDGLGARFGKDVNGQPFFESSHSGPIFRGGMFSQHAASKGLTGDRLDRAKHYDDIFDLITTSKFVQMLPNDTKVSCEILYNPLAEITDTGLKFVTVTYDRQSLGDPMSIVPIAAQTASTGEPHPQSSEIIQKLINLGQENGIKFINSNLTVSGDIDVNAVIDPILSLNDRSIEILQSRKKVDAAEKTQIKALIQTVKEELANFILSNPNISGLDRLGKDIEGIVISGSDMPTLKVTTPDFKSALSSKMQAFRQANKPS